MADMNSLLRSVKLPSGICLDHDIVDDGNEIKVVDMFKLSSVPLMNTFVSETLLYVRGLPTNYS